MPTLRRRNTKARSAGTPPLRSSLASAAWAFEDRVVWGTADLLRGFAEVVKWPFERIAWAAEHWVVWPIEEGTSTWGKPARAAALAGILALALAGIAGGAILAGSSGGGEAPAAQASAPATTAAPAPVTPTAATTQSTASAEEPVLHGAQPEFAPESGGGVHPKAAQAEADAAGAAAGVKTAPPTSQPSAGQTAVPPVAGPAAIAVTRKFAAAFVLYETGQTDAAVKKVFAETTSPDLEKALLRRPPRLPANVTVPQAKVVNVVLGPSSGGTQTLSISLLRVGVTSELRVDVQNYKGEPLVVDTKG